MVLCVYACGFVAKTLNEAITFSKAVTEVTHNHPEGLKGAEATAVAIFMARSGSSLLEIQDYINRHYYNIDFKLDEIRDSYTFDVSCQGSVPQALEAFFESTDFEDAIRNAISIGGDMIQLQLLPVVLLKHIMVFRQTYAHMQLHFSMNISLKLFLILKTNTPKYEINKRIKLLNSA